MADAKRLDLAGDVSEEAVHQAGSAFAVVNAIAKRSRQLVNGVPPLVTNADPEKPAMTALREIAAGVVAVCRRNGRPYDNRDS